MKNLIAALIASVFAVGAFAADAAKPMGDAAKAPAAGASAPATAKTDTGKKSAEPKKHHHKKATTKTEKPAA